MYQIRLVWVGIFIILISLGCRRAGFTISGTEDDDRNRQEQEGHAQLPIDSLDGDAFSEGADPSDGEPVDGSDQEQQPLPPPPSPNACEVYLDLSCQRPHESDVVIGPQEFYQDLDLNAADLTGEALYQSFWQRVNLERACAAQTNLTQTIWSNVDASHSDFQLAVFFGSELSQSQFAFAHLRAVNFTRSRFADLSFGEACLSEAVFRESEFRGSTDFTGIIAPSVNFFRSFFVGTASFQEANLTGANFEQSIFDRPVSFRNADLRGASFLNVEIANYVDFSNADLSGAVWSDGRICAAGSIGSCR